MEKIEHKIDGWQLDYGYIRWLKKDNEKYKGIFPENQEMEIILEGENIGRKKADWNMRRIYIGKKLLKEKYDEGDIVSIIREGNKVYITKSGKGVIKGPKIKSEIDLPLINELRKNQRNSDNPSLFEKSIVKAFKKLGFNDAKHLGGKDEPDIIIESFKVVIDAKTTKERGINEGYVNFPAMRRYREKYDVEYVGIVAPGFAQGNLINTAEKEGVVLIETEAICELLQNHAKFPYDRDRIVEILFKSDKVRITSRDVPPSIPTDLARLTEIASKILSDIKQTGKTSFSPEELVIAYSWQNLNYKKEEIEQASGFLVSFNILKKANDKYELVEAIESILKKMSLLVEIFNKIGGRI